MSVETVYTAFCKHILATQLDLRILSALILRHRRATTLDLPSWVPDWSQPKYGGGNLQRYYRFAPTRLFYAGGRRGSRIITAPNPNHICLEGLSLDSVARVISIKTMLATDDEHSFGLNETGLRKLSSELSSSEIYPFTNEPLWIALFRTSTANRTALSPRIHHEYRAKFFSTFGYWDTNNEKLIQTLPDTAWDEVSKGLGAIIEDKDVFLTQTGYVGLSQEGFEVGDLVCIFSGGELPLMFRPPEGRRLQDGAFQLLSEMLCSWDDGWRENGRNKAP
jgi:hypothetical protein